MINTIYIEQTVRDHERTNKILKRFSDARIISCDRYGEVFNPRSQNFRIQKQNPALIIAEKFKNFLLPAPEGFGIGGNNNFYFSHMLNCLYDCRYCFLQGMFQSANYVLFVNYEDFMGAIDETINKLQNKETATFFSGYDCDSLALESVTGFAKQFLPFFRERPRALLELRTKSLNTQVLLQTEAFNNCIIAFSFTPEEVSKVTEIGVPTVSSRIAMMEKLSKAGWKIGLRLDPLIYHNNYKSNYKKLINKIFYKIGNESFHSVSVGAMRFPKSIYNKIERLYPDSTLLASALESTKGMVSYHKNIEKEMIQYCRSYLAKYLPVEKIFQCTPWADE